MHMALQRIWLLGLLAASTFSVSGCSYVCHNYQPFTTDVSQGAWRIEGRVGRQQREDIPPAPGSVHHWRPDDRDRWWVELIPIARDTSYWDSDDVELADLLVVAGTDTIRLAWNVKVDLVQQAREYIYADGTHQNHGLEYGKFRFESIFFNLPKDVPVILGIQCRMIMRDADTGAVDSWFPLELKAVLDRHSRWDIVDAAEL